MCKFIQLTNSYNSLPLILNCQHIIGMFEQPDGSVIIEITISDLNENTVQVCENVQEIGELIKNAKCM